MIKIKALILISAGLLISAGASFADRQAEVMGYADIIQAFPGAKTEQFKYKFNIEQPQQIVKAEQPKASGWFSWARNKTANLLDNVGDFLRQPDNLKTDVGQIKHVAKQLTCDVVQAKTQIPVTTKIFSAIGNGARYLAGKFRTEPKTANLNSQLLDQAGINYHSKTNQALIEFKKVSEAFVETGKDDAEILKLADAARARGHQLSDVDVANNHAQAVASNFLKNNEMANDSVKAKKQLTYRLSEFLQRAGFMAETIKEYISNLYDKIVNAFKG